MIVLIMIQMAKYWKRIGMNRNEEPNGCPMCKSFNTNVFEPFIDETMSQSVECHDCGKAWYEVYEFKYWEIIKDE